MNQTTTLAKLWAIATVPALVAVATEINKTVLLWHFRIVDLADLVVTAPFYAVALLALHNGVAPDFKRPLHSTISLSFLVIFFYGHSMHVTANAINTYSTEIRNYRTVIPEDAYALLYFLDEDLGHWLTYFGMFGVLGWWAYCSQSASGNLKGAAPGVLLGLFTGVALVESSHPWLSVPAAMWMLGATANGRSTASYSDWRSRLQNDYRAFACGMATAMLVAQAIYFLVVGGFTEPSKMGL